MKRFFFLAFVAAAGCAGKGSGSVPAASSLPVINDFHASPASIFAGQSTSLSWDVSGAASLSIDAGVGAVTGTSKTVTPASTTTYTLTAASDTALVTRSITVAVSPAAQALSYADPAGGTAKFVLVKNAALSTGTHLVLDLKVGAAGVSAFGVALSLPFDAASAGLLQGGTSVCAADGPGCGVIVPAAGPLQPGSNPVTAAAKLVSGTGLPYLFTVGLAKHKASAGDTADVSLPAGATVLSFAIDLAASPSSVVTVFSGAGLQGNSRFRAQAVRFDGAEVAGKADFALGTLTLGM